MEPRTDLPPARLGADGSAGTVDRRAVEARVVADLGPYLGESMARAAFDGHCRSLGLGSGSIEPAELARLLAQLEKGLALFVGRDQAAQLIEAVAAKLDGGGGGADAAAG